MSMQVSPNIIAVHFPPISEVKQWVAQRPADGLPLVDLCQAVPDYAPAPQLTQHLSRLLDDCGFQFSSQEKILLWMVKLGVSNFSIEYTRKISSG